MTLITGLAYPLAHDRHRPGWSFPHQANGSLIEQDGKVIGSELIGQNFAVGQIFPRPPVGTTEHRSERRDQDRSGALQRRQFLRLQPGPDLEGADRPRQGRRRQAARREPVRAGAGRSGHHLGQRPRPGHHPGRGPVPGAARRQGAQACRRRACASWWPSTCEGRLFGLIGEPHVNVLKLNLALDALAKS